MRRKNPCARREGLGVAELIEGSLKVVVELFIGKTFGFKTASDQVQTRTRGWGDFVDQDAESTAYAIADNGVSYLSTNREGHGHLGFRTGILGVAHTKWTTLTPGQWTSEQRELPSGTDPTGHWN